MEPIDLSYPDLFYNKSIYDEYKNQKECSTFTNFLKVYLGLYVKIKILEDIYKTKQTNEWTQSNIFIENKQKWLLAKIKYGL